MFLRGLLPTLAIMLLCLATLSAQAQTCPSNNDRVTPDADLAQNFDAALHHDGSVTHKPTGLVWKQCSEGQEFLPLSYPEQCFALGTFLTWESALAAASHANLTQYAGHSDWRLPNANELKSIVETGCHSPSINGTRFLATPPGSFWTSTTYSGDLALAWTVNFINGNASAFPKSVAAYVRLVRGGQSFGTVDSLDTHCTLDIDGNGTTDPLTDGLLIVRALSGRTGAAVTSGAIGSGTPTRTSWAQIQRYLNQSCGANFLP